MMVVDMKALEKLGLTQYEIAVYLSLIKNGTIGAVELAKQSGVPFGRIYDILYMLESKSLIKVVLGKPKAFAPLDPKSAILSLLNKREEDFDSLKKEVSSTVKELSDSYNQKSERLPAIWVVRGDSNIRAVRARDVIDVEKEFCSLISPDVSTGAIPGLDKVGKEKAAKGVRFRWIENPITEEIKSKIALKLKTTTEIRTANQKGYNFSVLDSKRVRIEVNDPLYGRTSVVIENTDFAKAMKEFFEVKWKQAKPLKI